MGRYPGHHRGASPRRLERVRQARRGGGDRRLADSRPGRRPALRRRVSVGVRRHRPVLPRCGGGVVPRPSSGSLSGRRGSRGRRSVERIPAGPRQIAATDAAGHRGDHDCRSGCQSAADPASATRIRARRGGGGLRLPSRRDRDECPAHLSASRGCAAGASHHAHARFGGQCPVRAWSSLRAQSALDRGALGAVRGRMVCGDSRAAGSRRGSCRPGSPRSGPQSVRGGVPGRSIPRLAGCGAPLRVGGLVPRLHRLRDRDLVRGGPHPCRGEPAGRGQLPGTRTGVSTGIGLR